MPTLAEILAASKAKQTEPTGPTGPTIRTTNQTGPSAPPPKNFLADALRKPVQTPAPQPAKPEPAPAPEPADSHDAISAEEMADVEAIVEAEAEADDETDVGADEFTHASQPDKFDTAEYRQYKQYFEIVRESFSYPEQLASAMQMVMDHIRAHPQLADILHPDDIGTMVNALRESYGVAITRKGNKREKKAAGKADVHEAMDFLTNVQINI
jgi:hypothetical protein